MKPVQQLLVTKQKEFAQHPFFLQLDGTMPTQPLDVFAPRLAFWVMAFQDLLRINELRMKDDGLRLLAARHRAEDAGHDTWFLHDIAQLGLPQMDAHLLFGQEHQGTRDAAYLLIAEVLAIQDDRLRVALLLSVEAAGHVFFGRMARYVDDRGLSQQLKYFSQCHYKAEMGHDMLRHETEDEFGAIVFPIAVRAEAFALADRCFAAFAQMFDGLMLCTHPPSMQPRCSCGQRTPGVVLR